MPAISGGNLTKWRAHPQFTEGYLYIHIPDVVYKRRVNQTFTAADYPVMDVAYDNPDSNGGVYTDALPGYTMNVYSSAGERKGSVRLFSSATTTLGIAPTSQGDINFADNDILEVVAERRLWVKVPLLQPDGSSYKDYRQSYPGSPYDQPPVANAGPDIARKVNATTGLITITRDGSLSFPTAAGRTISTYIWDVRDGTITVGNANAAQITVTFPYGKRYISLTVIDSAGVSHTAYALIVAVDDVHVSAHQVRNARLGYSEGWEGSFELLAGDLDSIPDGAKVIYFTREKYNTNEGALNGYPGAEDVKFVGWITRHLARLTPLQGAELTINAQNTQALMAFSQTTSLATSPVSWFEMANLTWFRHLIYLIRWHTNLDSIMDIERPDYYAEYPSQRLDANPGTLSDQLNFLAQAVRARWTVDARGRGYLRRNPHQMTDAEQAALDVTVSLAAGDKQEPGQSFDYQDRDEVGWVWGRGVVASATILQDYEAVAPGMVPRGEGAQQAQLDNQLLDESAPWDDLRYRVSREFKRRNLHFRSTTIPVIHQGMIADPAWQEWIEDTVDASVNELGIGYTAKKFVLTGMEVRFNDDGSVDEVWKLDNTPGTGIPMGAGVPLPGQDPPDDGSEYIPNDGTISDQLPPDWNYVAPIIVVPDVLNTSDPIISPLAVAWNNLKATLTADYTASPPDWTAVLARSGSDAITDCKAVANALYVLLRDAGLYYASDVTVGNPTLLNATLVDYILLRPLKGTPGGILAYSPSDYGSWSKTFDFTVDDGGFITLVKANLDPDAAPGTYVAATGWQTEVHNTDGGGDQSALWIGLSLNVIAQIANFDIAFSNTSGGTGCFHQKFLHTGGHNGTGTYSANETTKFGSGSQTWNSSPNADADYIEALLVINTAVTSTLTSLTISGTGWNPFGTVRVAYSSDGGTTFQETDVADFKGDSGMDGDDYDLGVGLVAANLGIYLLVGYDDASPARLSDGDLTGVNGTDQLTSIRIPAETAAGALNNTLSAMEFIYATSGGYIGRVVFNASTGAVASDTDISDTDSRVLGFADGANGDALETYGDNSNRITAACKPVAGGSSKVIHTTNNGSSWSSLALDALFAHYVAPDQNGDGSTLWLAGGAGVRFSDNHATSAQDKNGDFATETGSGTALGAFTL